MIDCQVHHSKLPFVKREAQENYVEVYVSDASIFGGRNYCFLALTTSQYVERLDLSVDSLELHVNCRYSKEKSQLFQQTFEKEGTFDMFVYYNICLWYDLSRILLELIQWVRTC